MCNLKKLPEMIREKFNRAMKIFNFSEEKC